jgi:hypothetical protein
MVAPIFLSNPPLYYRRGVFLEIFQRLTNGGLRYSDGLPETFKLILRRLLK